MKSPIICLTEAKLGCLMMRIPAADAVKFVDWSEKNIPDCCLADDGREREIHVTVAYGFSPDVQADEVFSAVASILGGKPAAIQLSNITRFSDNPEYDVLKVDVVSQDLENLHYGLRNKFGERLSVSYDEYHPHLTLAYVKKGSVLDLDQHGKFNGEIYLGRELVYSSPDSLRKQSMLIVSESVSGLL